MFHLISLSKFPIKSSKFVHTQILLYSCINYMYLDQSRQKHHQTTLTLSHIRQIASHWGAHL